MPHKSQKKNHSSDINIESMKKILTNGDEVIEKESDAEVNSELDTSALSGSLPSETSDFDQDDPEEEEVIKRDLSEFIKFKIVSKDKALVILTNESRFYFKGKMLIKVLKGKLEVFGHSLYPCNSYVPVYSPRGYSLLDVHGFRDEADHDITEKLIAEGVSLEESKILSGDCIFVTKRLSENWTNFLHKNLNMKTKLNLLYRDQNIPQEIQNDDELSKLEKVLDVNLLHPSHNYSRMFKVGENWDLALTSVEITQKNGSIPKVLVAGGKGVGKSTFLRWLTNKLLAKSPVVFLDLDPGQAELALPGYLSVGLITQPFLGPNFCHVDRAKELSIYLGDINVANCPGRFMRITKRLVDFVNGERKFENLPVVINTMGWCRGVGLMLVIDTIRYSQPTTLVQLHSRFHRKNYPYSLDHRTVSNSKDCWTSSNMSSPRLSYSLLEFLAVPESASAKDMRSKDYWGLPDPRTTREAVLLSYLGKRWPSPVYRIHLSSLTLGVLHTSVDPACMLAVFNVSLVDLCRVEEKYTRRNSNPSMYSVLGSSVPVMPSLGVGFVRNIDISNGVLYLATDVDTNLLDQVNCLLVGSTKIPDCLLLSQKKKGSNYICKESTNPLDNSWQRFHKPRGNM